MVYIVSYDLQEPEKKYEELLAKIKEASAWAKLGGSAYLIVSDKTPVELRNEYRNVLDDNDKIYVGTVNPPAAGYGMPKDVSDWILKNVK